MLSVVDCDSEESLKKLIGRKEIEDALTNQESLMIVARNLEVTHRVDGVVRDVDSNVKATKVLTEDVDDNVKATKVLIEDIDDDVRVNVHGMQHFLSIFAHKLTFLLIMSTH